MRISPWRRTTSRSCLSRRVSMALSLLSWMWLPSLRSSVRRSPVAVRYSANRSGSAPRSWPSQVKPPAASRPSSFRLSRRRRRWLDLSRACRVMAGGSPVKSSFSVATRCQARACSGLCPNQRSNAWVVAASAWLKRSLISHWMAWSTMAGSGWRESEVGIAQSVAGMQGLGQVALDGGARHAKLRGDLRAGQAIQLGQQERLAGAWFQLVEQTVDAFEAIEDQSASLLRGQLLRWPMGETFEVGAFQFAAAVLIDHQAAGDAAEKGAGLT